MLRGAGGSRRARLCGARRHRRGGCALIAAASTCLGCGCACDDLEVRSRGGRIVEVVRACALGVRWFGDGHTPASATVDGGETPVEEAIAAAARLLAAASRTLVYVGPDLTIEAQREGVAIADRLRSRLDSITSATAMAGILAAQERGRAGATLGEVRHRADVVIYWGVDPDTRYPRYRERYAPPAGGARVVAVDVGGDRGPHDADVRVTIAPDQEVPLLTALAANLSSLNDSGRHLIRTLEGCRYVVIVADGESQPGRDPGGAQALIAWSQALHARTRCAVSTLRAGGNRVGADACLTWQTGYPTAVDFARGYPRYRPHATAGARVDAALLLGSAWPDDTIAPLHATPVVAIGPAATAGPFRRAPVAIDTAVAGIHEAGTVLRMDDVPIPVRVILDGPPAAASILRALRQRLDEAVRD